MSLDLKRLQIMVQNVEEEFADVENGEGWQIFFQRIRTEQSNLSFEITEAKKAQNKKLNRYQDVNPFDHSRIILKSGSCDYINASLVPVKKADRSYILAQGPLPHTTPHFWLMIYEQNSRAIIMLNRVIEKNMIKCHQYWPQSDQDNSYVFNDVGLKITNISEEKASYYTVTKLKLEHLATGSSREVLHFHYTSWPDFGCPQSPNHFLNFLYVVRNSGTLDNCSQPAVVHCSAGIGRSGTFCLVDSCLRMIKELDLDNVVVRDVLLEMRRSRMGLVQTADQLRFSYLAIIEGLKVATNGNGNVVEEVEEEEEPPPLPPPRADSLRNRQKASEKSRLDDNEGLNEQRKRERDERQEKLNKKVREVKEKLKSTETWQQWRRSYLKPLGIGAVLLGGGFLIYSWLTRG